MGDVADKFACLPAITGLENTDLCTEILSAHNWDLELAVSSILATDGRLPSSSLDASNPRTSSIGGGQGHQNEGLVVPLYANIQSPGLAWNVIALPFSIISGSLGLVSRAIGFGIWAASGVLSYSLSVAGLNGMDMAGTGNGTTPLVSVSHSAAEAMDFVSKFEREYGRTGPNFVVEGFVDALQRSRHEYKLLFVYLHSPEHPDTPSFCARTLCNGMVTAFLNENFVMWGGSVMASEGFKMSNNLKASTFPFCAVVMAATDQRIALLQQVVGLKSPEEMVEVLQGVLEESAHVLVPARVEGEERRNNARLREEQDAAYQVALAADQAQERRRREEQEQMEREAAEAERKRKEEEEARKRAEREAAEREAALAKMCEEKALSLGPEPEKGPDVTQVLIRFPSGERKGRRFHCSSRIQALYDYVDSLGCWDVNSYSLVSGFPRTVYGQEKMSLTLEEAGLHPQASLFVELS